jgi:hypothetical protein
VNAARRWTAACSRSASSASRMLGREIVLDILETPPARVCGIGAGRIVVSSPRALSLWPHGEARHRTGTVQGQGPPTRNRADHDRISPSICRRLASWPCARASTRRTEGLYEGVARCWALARGAPRRSSPRTVGALRLQNARRLSSTGDARRITT